MDQSHAGCGQYTGCHRYREVHGDLTGGVDCEFALFCSLLQSDSLIPDDVRFGDRWLAPSPDKRLGYFPTSFIHSFTNNGECLVPYGRRPIQCCTRVESQSFPRELFFSRNHSTLLDDTRHFFTKR
jgi:hypothetical protein